MASAVHETLVNSTWVHSMKAMGVHREWRPPAQPLRSLLRDEELSGEAPSIGDIMQILPSSRNAAKGYLWRKLLQLPESNSAKLLGTRAVPGHQFDGIGKQPRLADLPADLPRSPPRVTDRRVFDPQLHTPAGIVRGTLRDHGPSAVNRQVQKEKKPRAGPAAGTRSQVAEGAARSSHE